MESVKALKGKINSDEVALNLKLDPKARDQWIANGTLAVSYTHLDVYKRQEQPYLSATDIRAGSPTRIQKSWKWLLSPTNVCSV